MINPAGETAEDFVERYGITREVKDKFALGSQRKAALAKEIVPVEITVKKGDNIVFSNDEFVKPSTTNEILAKLKPAFRELGLDDCDTRSNPNGGAIAIGHPLGMSGARLLLTAMKELEVKNKEFALCTMCVGVGQGMATIIKRV